MTTAIAPTATGPSTRVAGVGWSSYRRALSYAGGALLVGALAAEVVVLRPYVGRAAHSLSHPNLWWLAVALAAELGSMAAFAHLQHRLLFAGGARVPMRRMLAVTYAANALSVTLPAGSALSSGYTFKRMRAWGASGPLATFTLIASGVLSTVAFAGLGVLGAVLAGGHLTSPLLLGVVGLAVVTASIVVRRLRRRPDALAQLTERGLRLTNRVLRRDPTTGQARVRQLLDELISIKPRHRDWLAALVFATVNWVADLLCLVASCRAVGASHSTITLALVAYLAGMTVSSLSFLPGGLGVVDAAMIVALVHGGLSPAAATTGVLLYRLISFVFVVVLGWAVWAGSWQVSRRAKLVSHDHVRIAES